MRLVLLTDAHAPEAASSSAAEALVRAATAARVPATVVAIGDGLDAALAGVAAPDVVVPRVAIRSEEDLVRVTSVLWALERRGVRCSPSAEGLVASEDRLRTFLRLRRAGVATPPTVAMYVGAQAPADVAALQERLRAFPVVVKRPVGRAGHGGTRCDDAAALRAALEHEREARPEGAVLLQPFLAHERSLTVRVAAGAARAARERAPARAPSPVAAAAIDEATARTAVAAAAACALEFAAVEFLDAASGERFAVRVDAVPDLRADDPDDLAFAAAVVASIAGAPPPEEAP